MAITSVKADARCGQDLRKVCTVLRIDLHYFKQHLTKKCFPFSILIDVLAVWSVILISNT